MSPLNSILSALFFVWIGGIMIGYSIAMDVVERDIIQHDCGYYDPKTSEFKWKMEIVGE